MKDECSICLEIKGIAHVNHKNEYNKLVTEKENIIWSNSYFTIIPSIGPLNFGHLLIVPNRHVLSMSVIDRNEQNILQHIKQKIRLYNNQKFNSKTEFFEHGTGCNINGGGSCISHAHLHVIPTNTSILGYLENIKLDKIDNNEIYNNKIISNNGYLFIEDMDKSCWLNYKDILPSQYLRKYYAKVFNEPEEWDWRKKYNINRIKDIIGSYKELSSELDNF